MFFKLCIPYLLIISGKSILETVLALRNEGIICEEAVCVLDREQGGPQNVRAEGITLHRLIFFYLFFFNGFWCFKECS